MTLAEKLSYVHGNDNRGWGDKGYIGQVTNITRLRIPSLYVKSYFVI